MILNDPSLLVVGFITTGLGCTVGVFDWRNRSSRPMAAFLALLGFCLLFNPDEGSLFWQALVFTLHAATFFTGIEWAKRIAINHAPNEPAAQNYPAKSAINSYHRRRKTARYLFLASQCIIAVFFILGLVYTFAIKSDQAQAPNIHFVRASGLEFALFAPFIATALIVSTIAGLLLAFSPLDRAEKIRLTILGLASPFLISGLVLHIDVVPFTMAIGILILCAGSMYYLIIQGQRGHFMAQFLAPEVAELVRQQGLERVMRRERRVMTIMVCDLRGFTAYARTHSSDEVMQLLEAFYDVVGQAAQHYGGTIKDHAGDGILLLVGAPITHEQHCLQAVMLANDIMQRAQQLFDTRSYLKSSSTKQTTESKHLNTDLDNKAEIGLGIGIATGNVTVGTIRGAGQLEYVAIGNAVNLAARLCDYASDGDILADNNTTQAVKSDLLAKTKQTRHKQANESNSPPTLTITRHQDLNFKGFSSPITAHWLKLAE